jgi:hypothetical protein
MNLAMMAHEVVPVLDPMRSCCMTLLPPAVGSEFTYPITMPAAREI